MSQTDDDLILVREVLARELETINSYLRLLKSAGTERVRAFLAHVTDEEKEHVAEALEIIRDLDPVQAAFLDRGPHSSGKVPDPQTRSFDPDPGWTIGSLRKQD